MFRVNTALYDILAIKLSCNENLMVTIVGSSNTDLNPIAIQALLISVFGESTIRPV